MFPSGRPGRAWLGLVGLGWVWPGLAGLSWARLGLGLAWLSLRLSLAGVGWRLGPARVFWSGPGWAGRGGDCLGLAGWASA